MFPKRMPNGEGSNLMQMQQGISGRPSGPRASFFPAANVGRTARANMIVDWFLRSGWPNTAAIGVLALLPFWIFVQHVIR